MVVTRGYRYRLYPTKEQAARIEHQCFVYNQAYNICLNLQQEQWEKNRELERGERKYLKAKEIDKVVKESLKRRGLSFHTVVTQQARINANKALEEAIKGKKGFPRFKNSKLSKKSFNWTNQGYQIKETGRIKYRTLKLMKMSIAMRYHRSLPEGYKMNGMTVSKRGEKYYVSFSVTYDRPGVVEMAKGDLTISRAVGIDVNVGVFALSTGELIETHTKEMNAEKSSIRFRRYQRKQSRRVLKSRAAKSKVSKNYAKTQRRINRIYEKAVNRRTDWYHKITGRISKEFDMVAIEALQVKEMTTRAKLKGVKIKSRFNRSIRAASFYQFGRQLEYKLRQNGKFFVRVEPQGTSETCSVCGKEKEGFALWKKVYRCELCGNELHRDINASRNILKRGLKSFGLGISLLDEKPRSPSLADMGRL